MSNENEEVQFGTIVQVTAKDYGTWYGQILVVSEVKEWGIQGYLDIPNKGPAYLRVKHGDYDIIGIATLTLRDNDEEQFIQ